MMNFSAQIHHLHTQHTSSIMYGTVPVPAVFICAGVVQQYVAVSLPQAADSSIHIHRSRTEPGNQGTMHSSMFSLAIELVATRCRRQTWHLKAGAEAPACVRLRLGSRRLLSLQYHAFT
jgi:hypothetical protein